MKKLIIKSSLILTFGVFVVKTHGAGWKNKSTLPTPRYGVCSVRLGSNIYVIGGVAQDDGLAKRNNQTNNSLDGNEVTDVVEKYSQSSNSWNTDIEGLEEERYNAVAAALNGKIYVIGGRNDDGLVDEIEIYDPGANVWETASHKLNKTREGAAAVVSGGKIYVIGGYGSGGVYLNSMEVFNPATNSWQTSSSMNYKRASLAAVVLDGEIYALGGYHYGPLSVVEKYNSGSGWTTLTDMPTSRGNLAAGVINSKIYVMGGRGQSGILSSTDCYYPSSETWITKESMKNARENFTAQVVSSKIYVFGGSSSSQTFVNSVEEYTPAPDAVEYNDPIIPEQFVLYQNYPNPFNNHTVIKYILSNKNQFFSSQYVNLTIYNVQGQQVITLVDELQKPGSYQLTWNGKNIFSMEQTSGVYFCVLKTGSNIQSIKLILAK